MVSKFLRKRLYLIHIHFDLRVSDFVLDPPEVGDFLEAIRLVLAPNACSKRWYRSLNGNLTIQYRGFRITVFAYGTGFKAVAGDTFSRRIYPTVEAAKTAASNFLFRPAPSPAPQHNTIPMTFAGFPCPSCRCSVRVDRHLQYCPEVHLYACACTAITIRLPYDALKQISASGGAGHLFRNYRVLRFRK